MHHLSDAKVPQMIESTNIAIYDATATGLAIGVLKVAGIDVIEVTEKMMGTALADGCMQLSVKQKEHLKPRYNNMLITPLSFQVLMLQIY